MRRQIQVAVLLACTVLVLGGLLLLTHPASAQLPSSTSNPPADRANPPADGANAPAGQTASSGIPVFQLHPAARPDQGSLPRITAINLQEHTIDMGQLGIHPLAVAIPPKNSGPVGIPGAPRLGLPDGATIGTSNAIMVASPDVVSQSTTSAIGTLLANFTPAETVNYYLNGALAGAFVADASGRVAVGISTGAGQGYITMEGIGQTSGKRAGTIVQVLDAAPPVPGYAAAPHAVNSTASGTFYAYGYRFLASSTVNLTRNGVSLGTAATNAAGRFFVTITPGNNGDTSAIYTAYTSTVGSMSGASVEERADAGTPPQGDQNPARAFVDRPIVASSTGGSMGIVGEGFQAGETVTIAGCASGTLIADLNGAIGAILTAPAGAAIYNCAFTGGTSGRVARASLQADPLAVNAPSAINRPSNLTTLATSFVLQYDRLLPNQSGTAYMDGVPQGAASTDANGNGFVTLVAPTTVGIHEAAFVGASNQVAAAPLYVVPAQGTATATATAVPPSSTATATAPAGTATPTCLPSGGGTPGPWTVVSPMPTQVYGNGGAGDSTYYYSVGGSNIAAMQPGVYRYDPVGNAWTTLAPIPTPVQDQPVIDTNGKLYAFGGLDSITNAVYNNTQIYDITAGTWSQGAPMPAVRFGSYAGAYNGKIYVAGGFPANDITTSQNQTWEYTISSNTWLTKATMPNTNGLGAYAVVGQYLYTFGGWRGNPCCDSDAFRYDMANDVWTTIASLPTGLEGASAAAANGKIMIYGGGTPFTGAAAGAHKAGGLSLTSWLDAIDAVSTTYIYDPATNTYTTGTALNQARTRFAGGNVGARAIAVGGYTGSGVTGSTETSNIPVVACSSVTVTPTPILTPSATPTCGGTSSIRILIVDADLGGQPTTLRTQLLAEPGVAAVDLFDAANGTPTLAQLQQYTEVIAFSDNAWFDATAMGDVLANYQDAGGVVVVTTFAFDSRGGWLLGGRWMTGGYTPFNPSATTNFSNAGLGSSLPGHPLMQGVSTLNAFYRNGVTLTAGATQVATYTDSIPIVAVKTTNGHTGVGINAYLGYLNQFSGDWAHLIVNAARWLAPSVPCGSVTATPTSAPSSTATRTVVTTPTTTPTCLPSAGTPGPFVTVSPISIDLYGAAVDSNGTVAYAAGGYSFSAANTVTQFSRFDPATNAWTALTPLPAGKDAAVALGVYAPNVNRFYVFGGAQGAALTTILNNNTYYDFASNTWGTGAPMPDVRSQMSGGYYNGKIYLVGGYNTSGVTPLAQTWEYDPVANTYTTSRAPLPQALGGAGFGIVNGHLYVAGGRDASIVARNTLYDYDIAANTWTTRANMPTGVNVPASAVILGKLMISGGGNPFTGSGSNLPKSFAGNSGGASAAPNTTNITQIYDPATNTWTSGPVLPQNLSFPTGAGIGNKVLVVGGYNGSSTVATTEISTVPLVACGSVTATPIVTSSPTPIITPSATPTCGGPTSIRILLVNADSGGQPTTLRTQLLAEAGVSAVDLFDATTGTPTLAQLQQYTEVVAWSNNAWFDATAMGNVLADYQDAGGVVVVTTFAFDNRGGWLLGGRWVTGGYTPFNATATTNFSNASLGSSLAGHPLMQGVSTLSAFFRNGVTLTAGATQVATYTDSIPIVAVKTTNGHTGVAINGYLGYLNMFSGDWAHLIVNAARWLAPGVPCGSVTATPIVTASPTPIITPSATPTCGGPTNWRTEPPLPTAISFAGGAADASGLYVVSGYNGTSYEAGLQRFNGTTWASLSPIPTPHSQAKVAALNGRLYVPGGYNSLQFGGPLTSMQIYDTGTGNWSQGAALPAARSGAGVVAFNGKVYIIGGFTTPFPTASNTVYEYDPVANTYTTKSPMPGSAGNVPATLLNGEIYVAGGSAPAVAYAYNPTTDTWRTLAAFPQTDCQAGGAFSLSGEVWVVGCLGRPITQQVWVYNPGSNTWRAGTQYAFNHEGGSAVALYNGRGYVAGGGAGGAASTNVESITAVACGSPTPTPPALTSTPTATATSPPTGTPTNTALPSGTPTDTPVVTDTPVPSGTPLPTSTPTQTSTPTNTATNTATATPTACAMTFSDVPVGYWAYGYIRWAYCRGIVSGYADNTFRPENNTTRSQIAKMVVLASGFPLVLPPGAPHFTDVPPENPFYIYIEVAYAHNVISGYADHTFQPYRSVTRAQLSKMIVVARGLPLVSPPTPTFNDVPLSYWAYTYIETAETHNIVGGYDCGGSGEPCPGRYFRPDNLATRAQLSKMLYQAFGLPSALPADGAVR
jgi:N-acetylneuraminic acid mutarotase